MSDALRFSGVVLPSAERRDLYVVGGRITYEPVAGAELVAAEGWVVPGLVDAHCHVGLDAHGPVDAAESERQALTDRSAGTLLIRDAGSAADTRWIDDRDDLPRIIRAGRHLARPRRYIRNYAHEIEPDELPAYVAQEAQRGDGWVKLVGDWIDRAVGDLAPSWPLDALRGAIATAHAHGARVTAHCFGEECLPDLLEAGIDCIEHGTGLTPDLIDVMAQRGVALVPTVRQLENFPQYAAAGEERYPKYAAHMRSLFERRRQTLQAAHEAGVAMYAGTDAGGVLPHGLIAEEIQALADVALGAAEALGAASWRARPWLGRPGGNLDEGDPADLVVYDADPRDDLSVLDHPRHVVLRGAIVS
ncbi:MAG: Xaa-Pro dipeptidase [uncultured Nocardioidaceae bacterium]|uniref:Xaa-Pro dipeptidase n=1 Tax=uncultured Nocardioidaceae bacterium TaxID=253824 RepID=A0A6J4MTG8_9ACTN|nr:MAG: Xaa-Pro dipeptidase [uncultured Nocardioidaceae bacterium]